MTMPECHNCPHRGDGWCLECVAKMATSLSLTTSELIHASAECESLRQMRDASIGFSDILPLLDRWTERLVALGDHDNVRLMGMWVKLWGDGSGTVYGEYAKAMPGASPEERAVSAAFMERTVLFTFDTVDELHGELVAQTTTARRGKED